MQRESFVKLAREVGLDSLESRIVPGGYASSGTLNRYFESLNAVADDLLAESQARAEWRDLMQGWLNSSLAWLTTSFQSAMQSLNAAQSGWSWRFADPSDNTLWSGTATRDVVYGQILTAVEEDVAISVSEVAVGRNQEAGGEIVVPNPQDWQEVTPFKRLADTMYLYLSLPVGSERLVNNCELALLPLGGVRVTELFGRQADGSWVSLMSPSSIASGLSAVRAWWNPQLYTIVGLSVKLQVDPNVVPALVRFVPRSTRVQESSEITLDAYALRSGVGIKQGVLLQPFSMSSNVQTQIQGAGNRYLNITLRRNGPFVPVVLSGVRVEFL